MRLYVVGSCHAYDWPESVVPIVTSDKKFATDSWRNMIFDTAYDIDPVDIETIDAMVAEFTNETSSKQVLDWTVNNKNAIDEMVTCQLWAVDVPDVVPTVVHLECDECGCSLGVRPTFPCKCDNEPDDRCEDCGMLNEMHSECPYPKIH